MEDVPLEDVVQPLALRQHAERALEGRLRKPTHARRIVAALNKRLLFQ
jgi:hypothetical protein